MFRGTHNEITFGQPEEITMPLGAFVNALPPAFFLLVHLVAFLIAAYFARGAFEAGLARFGQAFTLYAIAEIVYMTYHLDWTVFLFAHTIAEVLDLVAFVLVFSAIATTIRSATKARAVTS
jgi:hypothetical protein